MEERSRLREPRYVLQTLFTVPSGSLCWQISISSWPRLRQFLSNSNICFSEGAEWSEKVFDVFADLVHCAEWKPVLAKVISCDQQPRGRREGSPVPSLSLFDTSGPEVSIKLIT